MKRAVALFAESGKTLDQLGKDMGYDGPTARQAAWQFIKKTQDPRIGMLRKFAKAMGIDVRELFRDDKKK